MKRAFKLMNALITVIMVISAACYGISTACYVYSDGIVSSSIKNLGVAGGATFICTIFISLFLVVTEHTFVKAKA